jgi:hypothetical protein
MWSVLSHGDGMNCMSEWKGDMDIWPWPPYWVPDGYSIRAVRMVRGKPCYRMFKVDQANAALTLSHCDPAFKTMCTLEDMVRMEQRKQAFDKAWFGR